ncbi:MAG: SGNH/GDSL hydrolase family protein [Clostridia bacterium]|nr:SGNH/GDSL hydrolase family protein [Clostridia bacterium]
MCALKGRTVLLIGDSIMYGSGNGDYGPGEYLRDDLGADILKYCVGGARTGYYEGRSWIVEQVRKAITDGVRPDVVLFDGMTNDCYMTDGEHFDVPLGEFVSEKKPVDIFEVAKTDSFSVCFDAIVYALKTFFPDARLLYMRNHRMGRREEKAQCEYGEMALDICRSRDVDFVDIYADSGLDTFDPEMRDLYTNDTYGWGRGDCTHPNDEGYRRFYMPLIEEKIKTMI